MTRPLDFCLLPDALGEFDYHRAREIDFAKKFFCVCIYMCVCIQDEYLRIFTGDNTMTRENKVL